MDRSRPVPVPGATLVTVEAKLSDWRRGLGQAARHAAGADAAWLVLDGARTRPAVSRADWFRAAGVGLAGLDPDGTLRRLLPPGARRRPPGPPRAPGGAARGAALLRRGVGPGGPSVRQGADLPLQELIPGTQVRGIAVPGERLAVGEPGRRPYRLPDGAMGARGARHGRGCLGRQDARAVQVMEPGVLVRPRGAVRRARAGSTGMCTRTYPRVAR